MKKSLFAVVLAGALAVSMLAGCGSSASSSTSTDAAEGSTTADAGSSSTSSGTRDPRSGDTYTLGASITNISNPFYVQINTRLGEICEEKGWEYVSMDGNGDANKQITDCEDLVTQGADMILLNAYDPSIMKETVNAIRADYGVPIVAIDSGLDDDVQVLTTVQAANYDNGFECGKWCAKQMGKTPIKAALLSGEMGTDNSLKRRDGLLSGIIEQQLEDNGEVNLEVIFQGYCADWAEDSAVDQAGDLAALGEDFNVLLSEADVMTMAAIPVLEDAGIDMSKVLIVNAADGQKEAFELLMDESANYGCTGLNSPTEIANMSCDVFQKWIDGADWGDFSEKTYTPAACITADNVADYYDPDSAF